MSIGSLAYEKPNTILAARLPTPQPTVEDESLGFSVCWVSSRNGIQKPEGIAGKVKTGLDAN